MIRAFAALSFLPLILLPRRVRACQYFVSRSADTLGIQQWQLTVSPVGEVGTTLRSKENSAVTKLRHLLLPACDGVLRVAQAHTMMSAEIKTSRIALSGSHH